MLYEFAVIMMRIFVVFIITFFLCPEIYAINAIENINKFSTINFEKFSFDIAQVDSDKINLIKTYYKDKNENSFKKIRDLKNYLKNEYGQNLIFATNGGIFSKDYTPLGLYIENGKKFFKINKFNGKGNFYLKPNGIFLIQKGKAKIIETEKFEESPEILFALQSGPILVANNKINALFDPNSKNEYIRSGVGITLTGTVFFVISNEPVTFYKFALLFKEKLNCCNALYLDGAISEMYIPNFRENLNQNFSVIIGIIEK